jgi:hypothetical protein
LCLCRDWITDAINLIASVTIAIASVIIAIASVIDVG